MKKLAIGLLTAAVTLSATAASLAPAFADADDYGPGNAARYDRWQAGWDRYQYDRRHVILGRVNNFAPFRLQVARPDGDVQTIDLKNGTIILPTGATPQSGERVAVVGYWSRGTFIANRVLIR